MRHLCPHTVRYIDEESDHDKLYEVVLKTVQDRFFFVPFRLLNLLIIGVLAYAQAKTSLKICCVVFLSNHAHLLIRTRRAKQVADFFCLANSQIAKEVQRLADWTGGIFAKRYTITAVTDEPEAQEERLRYLLSQSVKEGLCPHPAKWPGVQAAKALLSGSMTLRGLWINRSKLYEMQYLYDRTRALKAANRRRNKRLAIGQRKPFRGARRRRPTAAEFQQELPLKLSTLPCWDHLSEQEAREKRHRIVKEILVEHQERIARLPRNWRRG